MSRFYKGRLGIIITLGGSTGHVEGWETDSRCRYKPPRGAAAPHSAEEPDSQQNPNS